MLSKKAGITIAVVAAAILAALIDPRGINYVWLGITGEETAGVKDAIQPSTRLSARRRAPASLSLQITATADSAWVVDPTKRRPTNPKADRTPIA
jgi:hypothetical protein